MESPAGPFEAGLDLALVPLDTCLELLMCMGGLSLSALLEDFVHTAFVSVAFRAGPTSQA